MYLLLVVYSVLYPVTFLMTGSGHQVLRLSPLVAAYEAEESQCKLHSVERMPSPRHVVSGEHQVN